MSAGLADVLQAGGEQRLDVRIVEPVVRHSAIAAVPHDPHLPHLSQLVTNRGLADTNDGGEIADTQLARCQSLDDTQPSRACEHLERVGQIGDVVLVDAVEERGFYGVLMYQGDVAEGRVERPCMITSIRRARRTTMSLLRRSPLARPAEAGARLLRRAESWLKSR